MNKRLISAVLGMVAFCFDVSVTVAAGDHGATSQQFPVTWTLTGGASGNCPNLPSGARIQGSGIETSITTTTASHGVTTIINTSYASGNATDERGNTYVWNYANHFSAANDPVGSSLFSGQMVDAFSLAGKGPYRLSNGFLATYTFDSTGSFYSIDEISSRGDPIIFGPFALNACDPL